MKRLILAVAVVGMLGCGPEEPREVPVERPPTPAPAADTTRDTARVQGDTIMLRDTATG